MSAKTYVAMVDLVGVIYFPYFTYSEKGILALISDGGQELAMEINHTREERESMPTQASSGLLNTIGAKLCAIGFESRRIDMNILQQGGISLGDVSIVLSIHIVHPIT